MFTIVNKGLTLTIINGGLSLIIINKGLTLMIINKTTNFLKTVVIENYGFQKQLFLNDFH